MDGIGAASAAALPPPVSPPLPPPTSWHTHAAANAVIESRRARCTTRCAARRAWVGG